MYAEVKNRWNYTPTPLISLMVWTGTTVPVPLPTHSACVHSVVEIYHSTVWSLQCYGLYLFDIL